MARKRSPSSTSCAVRGVLAPARHSPGLGAACFNSAARRRRRRHTRQPSSRPPSRQCSHTQAQSSRPMRGDVQVCWKHSRDRWHHMHFRISVSQGRSVMRVGLAEGTAGGRTPRSEPTCWPWHVTSGGKQKGRTMRPAPLLSPLRDLPTLSRRLNQGHQTGFTKRHISGTFARPGVESAQNWPFWEVCDLSVVACG